MVFEGCWRQELGRYLVDMHLKELVVDVRRVNDWLLIIKLVGNEFTFNVISSHAPQATMSEEVKRHFWEDLEEVVHGISLSEKIFIGVTLLVMLGRRLVVMTRCMAGPSSGLGTRAVLRCCIYLNLLNWC